MSAAATGRRFTEEVRQELARLPVGPPHEAQVELAALLRFGGSLTVAGGEGRRDRIGLELATTSGAVARRAYALTLHRFGLRAELLVRAPGGLQRRSHYGIRLSDGADGVATTLGLVDAVGRPIDGLPDTASDPAVAACARGAVLAAGSLSRPDRAPHLEIVARSRLTAEQLSAVLQRLVERPVTVVDGSRPRVVLKSGAAIGDLLAGVGASTAFLDWDDRRLRRQLRSEANRLANADAANLRRSIESAATQVRAVEDAIDTVGWDALDDDLRSVALARLANPTASLAELGSLVDPAIGKSAVHRRMRRLEQLARTPRGST